MYRISAANSRWAYELHSLAGMFLSKDEFCIDVREGADFLPEPDIFVPGDLDKNGQKRLLYDFLSEKTGKTLDWGLLTGVRPSKLYRELSDSLGGKEAAENLLKSEYLVSQDRIGLLREVYETQQAAKFPQDDGAVGVYIGIPFCPTRCLYCSFTSNRISRAAASAYMEALLKEICAVKEIMRERGLYAQSVYIGGGTPTSLCDEDFKLLLSAVSKSFIEERTCEFTVEAGRPDTISAEKLRIIKAFGADRISINPQTMKAETLKLIGREHSPEQIEQAFALAGECGIETVNADLIAGLPGEDLGDFTASLDAIIALGPSNVTVHTLAVKKASRLIEQDRNFALKNAGAVRDMLDYAADTLHSAGYRAYYMYRQKHMAGNFENVGYCKDGRASVYNIRIMEEDQTILALGAGGISKIFYPSENRLERVPNVSNYELYIERIDEMIERKRIII